MFFFFFFFFISVDIILGFEVDLRLCLILDQTLMGSLQISQTLMGSLQILLKKRNLWIKQGRKLQRKAEEDKRETLFAKLQTLLSQLLRLWALI